MKAHVVRTARDGAVAVVRLDRPARRNAMDGAMLGELLTALAGARDDAGVRCVVLSTTDVAAFSAGADLRELAPDDHAGAAARMARFAELYALVAGFPKPTVAVCVGAVVGGGAEVAAACAVRVAGDNLALRFPGVALGVPVGPARLVPAIGAARALDWLLSSRTVGAAEALAAGFVSSVGPAADAEAAAVDWAHRCAAFDPAAATALLADVRRRSGVVEATAEENAGLLAWQSRVGGAPRVPG